MARSTSGLVLRGVGLLLLAFLALAVVSVVLSTVVAIVWIAVRLLVVLGILAFVGALLYWGAKRTLGSDRPDRRIGKQAGLSSQDSRSDATDGEGWRSRVPGVGTNDSADHEPATEHSATERLQQRYVDGEITEAEFERRLQVLLAENEDHDVGRRSRERERH